MCCSGRGRLRERRGPPGERVLPRVFEYVFVYSYNDLLFLLGGVFMTPSNVLRTQVLATARSKEAEDGALLRVKASSGALWTSRGEGVAKNA